MLAELDDTRLLARWCSAVLAADAPLIAAIEAEADRRQTGLTAAAKKKKDEGPYKSMGLSTKGMSRQDIVKQSQKNIREGAEWHRGFGGKPGTKKKDGGGKGGKGGSGKGGGYNPFRKQSGKGGGQFTTSEDPQANAEDPNTTEKKTLDTERKERAGRRKGEDEAERRQRFEEDEAERARGETDTASKAERDAAIARLTGQITLKKQQLAEAQTMGRDDDVIRLTAEIAADQMEEERLRAEGRSGEPEAAKRGRDTERRRAREEARRVKQETRAREDAEWQARHDELQARIEAARARTRRASGALAGGAPLPLPAGRGAPPLVAAPSYNPDLHPRGKDGQWIEKFGLVDLFGLSGFQHGQRGDVKVRGEVQEVIPDPKRPGDPIIRVKMTDPRWDATKFGPTVDVRRKQVGDPNAKIKAKIPGKSPPAKTPIAQANKPKLAPVVVDDLGVPPPRHPTPAMLPNLDGPNFQAIVLPQDWTELDPPARLAFLKKTMEADYKTWRGEDTEFDFTGFDSGLALNMANAYRELTNWDPDTARRIDRPIIPSAGGSNGLSSRAIAVAHPGTAHPGGIGEKTKPSAMVFGVKYYANNLFWEKQKQIHGNDPHPHSISSKYGDGTLTLAHEFAHHRQFRYLDIAMRDANKAWSPVVRDDGFGLIPDSSNWAETQALRYEIPKLAPSKYGNSKSSEGFAEAWTGRLTGDSSDPLVAVLDEWDGYMGLMLAFPPERHWETKSFDELTASEKDQFWLTNGAYLELPGMRDHYPDTAAAYDAWMSGAEEPTPSGVSGVPTKGYDWEEDEAAMSVMDAPISVAGLSFLTDVIGSRKRSKRPPGPLPWTVTVYDPEKEELQWTEGGSNFTEPGGGVWT